MTTWRDLLPMHPVKLVTWGFVFVGVVFVVSLLLANLRATQTGFQQDLRTLRALNDSTVAQLTQVRLDRKELQGLLVAAKELDGELIAAVRLIVRKRDTTVVHDTLPTEVRPDSTRVASFTDSTFAGRITGRIIAPPCCGPLSFSYKLERPEFSPSIGFVQRGDAVAAVVTWQGEKVEVSAPFARIPVAEPRLRPFVEGGISTLLTVRGGAGAELRLGKAWYVSTSVQQDVPTDGTTVRGPQAWLALRRKW